jgi:hypothetical protein
MRTLDASQSWWAHPRRHPVDDAYTAWFNAHSRCSHALRAWNTAARGARAAAYRAYVIELRREEFAADELERLHVARAAA